MKLHAFKYILSASMTLSSLTVHAIYPDSVLQQKMLLEEQAFLAKMKPGLQHMQMLAVRAAMQGNDSDLQKIRESRNQAWTRSQNQSSFA